jgi:hypothetical protein
MTSQGLAPVRYSDISGEETRHNPLDSKESDFLEALGKVFLDEKWDGVALRFSIVYRFDETLSKLRDGDKMVLSSWNPDDPSTGVTVELRRVPYQKLHNALVVHYCGRPLRFNGVWEPEDDVD